jgi:2-hydroxymuconate-semialdehyde hydrolase
MNGSANPFSRLEQVSLRFEGLSVNGWRGGQGPAILLLHGSGPGASSIGNWRPVLDELAAHYEVLALDLVGFGGSVRKAARPSFDFDLWLRQAHFGLRQFDQPQVGVIGHSISGALALHLAATVARVTRVMTTGTMGADMPVNPALDLVWRCPRSREDMRQSAQVLIHDHSLITDAYLDARMAIIGDPAYQDYFDDMFADDFATYIAATIVPDEKLVGIRADVAMLHGRDDLPFPAQHTSCVIAPKIRNADLTLLSHCSHSVAMERTEAFMSAARSLFG